MPSSTDAHRIGPTIQRCLIATIVLASGCAPPPAVGPVAPVATAATCTVAGGTLSPDDEKAVATLRQTVEKSPLYEASAAKRGVATCTVTSASGEHILEYRLRDRGWMRVTYQPRIEYSDQEVRLTSQLDDDPVALLTRAERAAFGADGCGIDWRNAETRIPEDEATARETIYRGDVCNCQARVRRDSGGRIVGLIFRSAC